MPRALRMEYGPGTHAANRLDNAKDKNETNNPPELGLV